MKKIISLFIILVFLYSCGSNAIVMKSPNINTYNFKNETIIISDDHNCKKAVEIASFALKENGFKIIKDKKEKPKYKCVLVCDITYKNTSEKDENNISNLNITTKIYTYKDDTILYTINMSEENFNGINLDEFKKIYSKEMSKSLR